MLPNVDAVIQPDCVQNEEKELDKSQIDNRFGKIQITSKYSDNVFDSSISFSVSF